jgi:hypothetical protein
MQPDGERVAGHQVSCATYPLGRIVLRARGDPEVRHESPGGTCRHAAAHSAFEPAGAAFTIRTRKSGSSQSSLAIALTAALTSRDSIPAETVAPQTTIRSAPSRHASRRLRARRDTPPSGGRFEAWARARLTPGEADVVRDEFIPAQAESASSDMTSRRGVMAVVLFGSNCPPPRSRRHVLMSR